MPTLPVSAEMRSLIAKLLTMAMGRKPDTAALVRTTMAATRVTAGLADNVLPQTGVVTFNARHLPGAHLPCAHRFMNMKCAAHLCGLPAL